MTDFNYIEQLSIDCVIFGYRDRQLKVLLSKLRFTEDFYGLPSGWVDQKEGVDEAAHRILGQRTGINNVFLQQFHVFGHAGRTNKSMVDRMIELDPNVTQAMRGEGISYEYLTKRFVTIGYYALTDMTRVVPQAREVDESLSWYDVADLPPLVLDHTNIVNRAHKTLRRDLDEQLSAFNLLPETFTMKEVRRLYETIYDRRFVRSNFQRKILGLNVLERLGKQYTGAANKAPYLYRFQVNGAGSQV